MIASRASGQIGLDAAQQDRIFDDRAASIPDLAVGRNWSGLTYRVSTLWLSLSLYYSEWR